MKNLIIVLCLIFSFVGCKAKTDRYVTKSIDCSKCHISEQQDSGIGMTLSGKLGVEIAPNIVLPFDGGFPEFGF